MKVLFDTNIFRDVQRGRISADQVKQARRKITAASAQSCVSPLTLVELGSHVCDEEKTHYEKYRCAFEAITALCDTALADPEMFMRREVFGAPLGQYGLSATDTLRIIRLIAKTPRYTTLRKGQVTLWGPTPSRVFLKTGYLKQFRDKVSFRQQCMRVKAEA